MKKLIFIEGISGAGKSTAVHELGEKLRGHGYSASYYIEGSPDSPLDLCWVAYLLKQEYNRLLTAYPVSADGLAKNIVYQDSYVLIRYQAGQTPLFSGELYNELREHELCYKPVNAVPLAAFTEVFSQLWRRFAENGANCDYVIFDAPFGHMISDLSRNYNASENEIMKHLKASFQAIEFMNPIVFYLSPVHMRGRLIEARRSRGQTPPSEDQIAFWEKRKQLDLSLLPTLPIELHIKDIDNNWNQIITDIIAQIT